MDKTLFEYFEILNNLYEGIYVVNRDRKITFWNKEAENISGFTSAEIIGHYCYDNILNHVDEKGNALCIEGCPLHKTIADGETRETVLYLHHKKGHRVAVAIRTVPLVLQGDIIGAVEIFSDDSKQIEMMSRIEELQAVALRDHLTDLPNRRYLDSFLANRIKELKELDIPFSVAMFDIDHFKRVNDDYGHDIGDEVLKMVANTLRGAFRKNDIVGRWGGEEFLAIIPEINDNDLLLLLNKARILVAKSVFRQYEHLISVTISAGVTNADKDDTIISIQKRADEALYESKENGRNRITAYRPNSNNLNLNDDIKLEKINAKNG